MTGDTYLDGVASYGDIPPEKTEIRKCIVCGEGQEIQYMQWSGIELTGEGGWLCSACKPKAFKKRSEALEELKKFEPDRIQTILLDLPGAIKVQSLKLTDLATKTEKLRLSIASIKNSALELVLNATDAGKPKYSNDKARNLATEQILRENKLYFDNCDELGRLEYQQRTEQIELEYLHNLLRSYIAVAGLQGVRS